MARLIEIQLSKAVIFVYEHDLYNYLPRNVIEKGLKRGKAIKRKRQADKRARYPE